MPVANCFIPDPQMRLAHWKHMAARNGLPTSLFDLNPVQYIGNFADRVDLDAMNDAIVEHQAEETDR
jgi:hypothetical protein